MCLLVGISEGSDWGWSDPRILGLLAAAIVLLVLWVRNEQRAAEPLVDMKMMRIRGVWTVNAAAFLVGAGMYSSFVLIPQFTETPTSAGYGFGASVTQAGLFLLPTTVMMLLVSPFAGRLANSVGARVPLILGSLATCLAFTSWPSPMTTHGRSTSASAHPRRRHRPGLRLARQPHRRGGAAPSRRAWRPA